MSDLQVLSNDRLSKLIEDTQETLDELKLEVERREQLRQEYEVLDLENHMQRAELSLTSIREFINYLLKNSRP